MPESEETKKQHLASDKQAIVPAGTMQNSSESHLIIPQKNADWKKRRFHAILMTKTEEEELIHG